MSDDIPTQPTAAQANHAETQRLVGQLASGIAHDLNQSLGVIAGYAELALHEVESGNRDSAEVRRHLELIHRVALDGGTTLARLLGFARSLPEPAAEPINVRALLDDVAELTAVCWRDMAQADGRPIHLDVEGSDEATILGWRSSLQQMLTNLIFNAIDALPHGGHIRLRVRREVAAVEVAVIDNGIGIPPDVRTRIFEPFFTTKGARGTGLGLVQIQRAIDQHGGSVAVDSVPGQGTTFHLIFPLGATPEPPAATTAEVAAKPAAARRVLVVDDEPALAHLGATVLAEDGHAVSAVHSAEEALVHLERAPVDVVVSDLSLGGGMNGWRLAGHIKSRWPATKFVLVTGWAAGVDPHASRAAGVDAVIAKPYRLSTLRAVLASGSDSTSAQTAASPTDESSARHSAKR